MLALAQTRGRGQRGREWLSPAGRGIYATLLPRQRPAAEQLPLLPLLAGVGLCRALNGFLPRPCRLKWPNDLVVGGRKIGGVLIETVVGGAGAAAVVLGFGVNHSLDRDELPTPGATSVALETPEAPSLGRLAGGLVRGVLSELMHLEEPGYAVERYQRYSLHRPGDHLRYRRAGEAREGVVTGFDRRGYLRVRSAAGEELLAAGELMEP